MTEQTSASSRAATHEFLSCPRCGSPELSSNTGETGFNEVSRTVTCAKCNNSWTEVFTFAFAEDEDGNVLDTNGNPIAD